MILYDTEDGEPLCVVDYGETRKDSNGKTLGPKPLRLRRMSYDQKQIESPVEDRLPEPAVDLSGTRIDGPWGD